MALPPPDDPDGSKSVLVALLGGGLLGSIVRDAFTWLRTSKRENAEADATIANAQTRFLTEVRQSYAARIAEMTKEIQKLREEVAELRKAYDDQQLDHVAQLATMSATHTAQMQSQQEHHDAQMRLLREQLEEAKSCRGFGD